MRLLASTNEARFSAGGRYPAAPRLPYTSVEVEITAVIDTAAGRVVVNLRFQLCLCHKNCLKLGLAHQSVCVPKAILRGMP